jgi:hypothetical protein
VTAVLLGVGWGALVAWPVARRARRAPARRRAAGLGRVPLGGAAPGARAIRWIGGIRPDRPAPATRWTTRPGVRVVVAWVTRRRPDRSTERGAPLALDLVTMAARAGFTPRLALATGARWAPVDVAAALARVERRCALGASLTEALADLGAEAPALRGLADALVVAERSGAPVGEVLGRVADELRVDLRRRAEAHARRVPVRLLFPLVFLALPAFGLLTVVPTLVAGLRQS